MSKLKTSVSLCDNDFKKNNRGFSILEVVAAIFIFSVVTVTIYGSYSAGLKSLAQSRHRVAAAELANEKMEIIRNLPYNQVGTQGGVPSGVFPQNETVWKSNQKFNVRTTITYVDDPLDGTDPNDSNGVSRDYRKARVEVTWGSIAWGRGVILISNFVPDGVENETGGGTLRFNVIDSTGAGVAGADAHIVNNSTSPHVDITTQTDSAGSILMAGMPAGDQTYEFTVSKSGYESIATSPPYPATAYEPVDVHGSVIEGDLSSKSVILDKLGDISFASKNMNDQAVPNVNFHLEGGRVLGHPVDDSTASVFAYDQDLETNAQGVRDLGDAMSPGDYTLTFAEPGYTLIGTEAPLMPFSLAPDQNLNLTLIVADNSVDSLIVKVLNNDTAERINGASVHLTSAGGFDQTLVTGEAGQVFFPAVADPPVVLSAGEYNLEVSAPGFQNYAGTVNVSQLTQTEVKLVPE